MFGPATITAGTPAGTQKWVWTPPSSGVDPHGTTYTIEQGDATRAMKAVQAQVTGLSYEVKRGSMPSLGGEVLARALQLGQTLTASPTSQPNVLVKPTELCIYADPTFATIGTTKLLGAISAKWEHKGRRKPFDTLDCANPSFSGFVDLAPNASFELVMDADTVGESYMNNFRNGTTFYLSCVFTSGTNIGVTTAPYKLTHKLAVQVEEPEFGEQEDAWAATYKLRPVHDSSMGGSEVFELITGVAKIGA